MSEKLVLIDGHSILNRAFYGVPDLSNSEGLHTNAVYGFLNILFKLLEEEKPEYLTVAFDVKAPTFRHEMYPEYKGTRKPMPQELHEQVPVMKQVLHAMGIRTMEQPGLEADDILGTLAKRAEKEGMDVSLVSGDRDLLQIASDKIKIRIPKTKGARTEVEDYYAADVEAKYGVTPAGFIELKALMGDTADNIPGVPKVGEKTASELLKQFRTLDNLYAHVEEVTKKAVRESLIANKDLAYLSLDLATIRIDSPVVLDWNEARLGELYTEDAYQLFRKLEFKNLLGRFEQKETKQDSLTAKIHVTSDLADAQEIFEAVKKAGHCGFAVLSDQKKCRKIEETEFCGLALCWGEEQIAVLPAEGFLTAQWLCSQLSDLYLAGIGLSTFEIKKAYPALLSNGEKDQDSCGTKTLFDVLIAVYLLNPLKNDYEPEDIAKEQLDRMIRTRKQLFEKLSLKEAYAQRPEEFYEYAGTLAYVCYAAVPVLSQKLEEAGMQKLFDEIEMPVSRVLYEMEKEGVLVRRQELQAYGDALDGRGLTSWKQKIHEAAGCEFNINSPKQLGEILFEKMELQGGKKTKTGYSTAADVLEKLAPDYPVVADILEYRQLTKLKSTYADGLAALYRGGRQNPQHLQPDHHGDRTHFSSTEPNLQNIPMRMELGRHDPQGVCAKGRAACLWTRTIPRSSCGCWRICPGMSS